VLTLRRRISRVLDINIAVFTVRPSAKLPQVQMLLYLIIMYLMLIGEQTKIRLPGPTTPCTVSVPLKVLDGRNHVLPGKLDNLASPRHCIGASAPL